MLDVSIIVPFRNNSKFLENCIQNLLNLEYKNYEIILLNDGSNKFETEQAKKIIDKYQKQTNIEIRYYYVFKQSEGVGEARNYGIDRAMGTYIMFVDVDDEINEKILQNLYRYIDDDIDIIKYQMQIIYPEKQTVKKTNAVTFDVTTGENGFNKLCFKDKYLDSPCLYLIKRELFEKNNIRFPKGIFHEDFALIPLLIVNAKTMVSTKYYDYNYIQTENSIMRILNDEIKIKKVRDKFGAYDNMIEKIKDLNISCKTEKNMKRYYTNSIIMSLKQLDKKERNLFIDEIKKRNMMRNIKPVNFKQFIKWILINMNINWYFNLRGDDIA